MGWMRIDREYLVTIEEDWSWAGQSSPSNNRVNFIRIGLERK